MAELEIEPLSASNVDELADFLSSVDPTHFAHASRSSAKLFLGQPRDIHVLGRVGREVVAFGMLRGWEEGFEIPSLGIAVARAHEGRGYGRAMMTALEGLALARGARQIRLRVDPDNGRAQRLYETCGYRAAGIERGEILMLRDLP